MQSFYLVMYILAALCFLTYAVMQERHTLKINLLGLGVFFWALVPLVTTLNKL